MLEQSESKISQIVSELSVTEISAKIKNIIELNCGYVRVKGEISGLKIATSGHAYLNLKDDNAILSATCWRHVLGKLKFTIEDGAEVIASGKITAYPGQSKYQMTIEDIETFGAGALMKLLNERKAKFEKEGLFLSAHKKPLPFLPKKIGVITSITGSVIRDILHRISDRFPSNVIIWPVAVQGVTSAKEVSDAIDGFNNLDSQIKPDVIIVARGGGSIEDLWSFNEEVVVRAVAASSIPIISAVGHETDFTLLDFVADVRAPTPTAAAEFVVPVLSDLKLDMIEKYNILFNHMIKFIRHKIEIVSFYTNILRSPDNMMSPYEQKLDFLELRYNSQIKALISKKRISYTAIGTKLNSPDKIIHIKKFEILSSSNSLLNSFKIYYNQKKHEFILQATVLDALDYHKVLKRGFAIIRNQYGIIASSSSFNVGEDVIIDMYDCKIDATIIKIK